MDLDEQPGSGPAAALDFLRTLYREAPEGSFIELRTLGPERLPDGGLRPRTEFFDAGNLAAVARAALAADKRGADAYVGVQPRRQERGRGEDVAAILALYVDLDAGAGKPHADPAAALAHLRCFPLPPSLVVKSGGGFHAYWLLKEPLPVEEHDQAEAIMRRLSVALGTPGQPLDYIGDLPRILRVPGTCNHKLAAPRPVILLECADARRYNLLDFDDLLPELPAGAEPARAPFTGELPEELSPRLRRVLDRVGWPLREKRDGGKLQALVLCNPCPACATVTAADREPARAGTAHVAPLSGALRCKRSRCPATGDGLPLGTWVALYAPHALSALPVAELDARLAKLRAELDAELGYHLAELKAELTAAQGGQEDRHE